MSNITNKTLRQTTEEWVESQGTWVSDPIHAPAIAQLLVLSDGIDQEPTKASLHSQYGLVFRSLLAEKPKDDPMEDDLDRLLRDSSGLGVTNG